MAVKVLTDRKEAEIELKIATDICGQNLPGITKLLDNGIVSSLLTARDLEVDVGSIFLVYEYIDKTLKKAWDRSELSDRDIL